MLTVEDLESPGSEFELRLLMIEGNFAFSPCFRTCGFF